MATNCSFTRTKRIPTDREHCSGITIIDSSSIPRNRVVVTGILVDEFRDPLPQSVIEVNDQKATVTDHDGFFVFESTDTVKSITIHAIDKTSRSPLLGWAFGYYRVEYCIFFDYTP